MKQIIASKEKPKNPFDARTKDAKAFLERMAKRKMVMVDNTKIKTLKIYQ